MGCYSDLLDYSTAHIIVNNEMKEEVIYDVIGTIYGSVEPGKYTKIDVQ